MRTVTKTGTGLYTFKMQDNYQRILRVDFIEQLAGGLGTLMGVGINSTLTNLDAAGGSEIAIALLSATVTAADPAVETILFTFTLADSTAP